MKIYKLALTLLLIVGFTACSDEKIEVKSSAPGMKCGAGKCGANMFDGSSALAKKKINILRQLPDDCMRRDCVKQAKTTKATYDCVRSLQTNKLNLKCAAGKCGKDAKSKKAPAMKCGTGKCGEGM